MNNETVTSSYYENQVDDYNEISYDPESFDITSYPADWSLSVYQEKYNSDQFIIPNFQRNYVWSIKQASRLIESFLLGLPVPQVFLYKNRVENAHQIIDGLQRITSVVDFLNGYHSSGKFKGQKFELKGIHQHWNKKCFEDLSSEEQFKLKNAVMRAMIIQQHTPDNDNSVYEIFERLNTGGTPLNPMQVRMCIADGPFTEFLKRINLNPLWRTLINMEKEDDRVQDIEYLLRIFAIIDDGEHYQAPMKRFLTSYIEKKKKISQNEIQEKEILFHRILHKIKSLSPSPFHKSGKISKPGEKISPALMDALVFAIAKLDENQTTASSKFDLLLEHTDFLECINAKNTSDTKILQKRLDISTKIFSQ